MFGYITIAPGMLTKEQQDRYRSFYCGLCHTLGRRHGQLGRMTLSYDATFLYLLLTSLYEPDSVEGTARCLPHPFKPHSFVQNELAEYCADMNIALAYHKCLDDWQDDKSLLGRAEAAALQKAYDRVHALYPEKCLEIERCLKALHQIEKSGEASPDVGANLSARMLGVIYRWREDQWADELGRIGEGLGRFVYLMDAYDDLEKDLRKKRYNPLAGYHTHTDYEDFVVESLTMLIAECTDAFETLPLVQDMDILRNILYAGCWSHYQLKQQKSGRKDAAPVKDAQ